MVFTMLNFKFLCNTRVWCFQHTQQIKELNTKWYNWLYIFNRWQIWTSQASQAHALYVYEATPHELQQGWSEAWYRTDGISPD